MAAATLASLPPQWHYDVFLSFRGPDTRKGFLSHLYRELQFWKSIKTFKDDRDLEIGATISPELLTAIEGSHLAIIVLSQDYASSTWCLNELTKIVDCMQDGNRILPIFYDVDPSDVRHQRGSFAEAFAEHEQKFGKDADQLNQWRAALTKAANLSGWDSKNKYRSDSDLIQDIVECVWSKVNPTLTLSNSQEKLVGIDFAFKELLLGLDLEVNDDVQFIGIWGMGGLGKTTLAKLVFERISHHFQVSRFLSNVRGRAKHASTLVDLQKQLLFPILKENIWDEDSGMDLIKKVFSNKKVLMVLDDVHQLEQLEKLAGDKHWFGMGSRIIITTRDKRLLVQHGITTTYKIKELDYGEALKLFSLNAFGKEEPEEDFFKLSQCFLDYAKGIPLVLKVLGRSVQNENRGIWESRLKNLQKIHDPKIFDILKVSYDGLTDEEKMIFLDVACFHRGKKTHEVIEKLDATCDISSPSVIRDLFMKSLLMEKHSFHSLSYVEMHDLIQEMAWKIVRGKSKDPSQYSRLWLRNDICNVFTNNKETRAIEGVVLWLPHLEEVHHWNCQALSKMHGLRILEFNNLIISSCPKFLPNSLRLIHWSWFPSKALPQSFQPDSLTELKMCHSKLVRLWDGRKDLPNLKFMDVSFSKNLSKAPNFSGVPNLERLRFVYCRSLVEIHASIADLKSLKRLEFEGCENIQSLPITEVQMESLEYLSLDGCSKVTRIPEFAGQMKKFRVLDLSGTAIEQVPSSIGSLVGLAELRLSDCTNLSHLSSAICNLKSLRRLYMDGCSKVEQLPGEMECLEELALGRTAISGPLPLMKNLKYLNMSGSSASVAKSPSYMVWSFISSLRSLQTLFLRNCKLQDGDIPDDIGFCLPSLQTLDLSGNNFVTLPASIERLSKLQYLNLERCTSLQQLPNLPLYAYLKVSVDNCTSLKTLSGIPFIRKRDIFSNEYDGTMSFLNCITLVEDKDWTRYTTSLNMKRLQRAIIYPGSEIPEWFNEQSVGHSLKLEPPPSSCRNWLGIAFCIVFSDDWEGNVAALHGYEFFEIKFPPFVSLKHSIGKRGHLMSEHIWLFFLDSEECQGGQFSFETYYTERGKESKIGLSMVKKCGARFVFQEDLYDSNHDWHDSNHYWQDLNDHWQDSEELNFEFPIETDREKRRKWRQCRRPCRRRLRLRWSCVRT